MDRLDWDALQTFQGNLSSNHQNDVHNFMASASNTNTDWDNFCKYARHTVAETQSSMGVNPGWKGVGAPSQNAYVEEEEEEEEEDHDGEPLEEDPELARKRQQLREIEERIIRKKASIALKTVEPSPDTSCQGATLKERVNQILQQQKPPGFLATVNAHKERMNSSKGLRQDDHPLKLRVKALMKQRHADLFVLSESSKVPDVPLPPPDHSLTSPAKESSINEGFQRFLSVLNKGVDMDFLSRVVNDDSEVPPLGVDLLNIQPHAVENKPDLHFSKEQPASGASLPGHRETSSGERRTDPASRLRALSHRLSLPGNDVKTDDRGGHPSGSRSKSPPAVKKKKKEEEEKPKMDEQHQQLQNILKTLGLSLEVEEMSKLADRTQERLYGKKQEDKRSDGRGEQQARQRSPQKHYTHSSVSSSSSSSSKSSSRSYSRSPSSRHSSHSRDSRSERRHSRDRSGDRLSCDGREAKRYMDKERQCPNEISPHQQPYPENHTYPQPYAADGPAYPDYSEYDAYHSGSYSEATDPYWASSHHANPSSFYPYPPDTYNHFAESTVEPNMAYPHHNPQSDSLDFNLIVNPDLSKSEGQSVSRPRCLQVVNMKPTDNRCLKRLTKPRRRGRIETRMWKSKIRFEKKKLCRKQRKYEAKRNAFLEAQKIKAQQNGPDESESEEEKRLPTEEEIKANLRKKLEAFNQKVKEKVNQPTNCLTSDTG